MPRQHRSAALQALGEIIVDGADPPDALSTLLDSLRNAAALAGNSSLGADGGGNVDRSGGGTGGGVGSGEKSRGLVGRVMKSLSLWSRRLKKRSDDLDEARDFWMKHTTAGGSAGAPVSSAAHAAPAGGPNAAVAAAASSSSADSAVSTSDIAAKEVEQEEENEGAREDDDEVLPWTAPLSSTLYGDCLEVAAIKSLAVPRDALPVRFFAVLAAAASPADSDAGDDADSVVAPQMTPPLSTRGGIETAPVRVMESLEAGNRVSATSTRSPIELLVAKSGAEAKDTAAAAVAAAAGARGGGAAAGVEESGRVVRQCRSALAGVLEIVRGRMNGQPRLSEELLGDEVIGGLRAGGGMLSSLATAVVGRCWHCR